MSKSNTTNILIRIIFLLIVTAIIFAIFFFKPNQKENSIKYFFNNFFDIKSSSKKTFIQEKKVKKVYFVQLGVFAKESEVDKITAKVKILNFNPSFEKKFHKGKIVTKIILGPYDSMSLDKTISILEDNNIQHFIINEKK